MKSILGTFFSEAQFVGDLIADTARFVAKWGPKLVAGAILLYVAFISFCCLWPVLLLVAGMGLAWWLRRPLNKLAKIIAWLVFAVLYGVMIAAFVGMLAGCSATTLLGIALIWHIMSPPRVIVVVVDSHGNKI